MRRRALLFTSLLLAIAGCSSNAHLDGSPGDARDGSTNTNDGVSMTDAIAPIDTPTGIDIVFDDVPSSIDAGDDTPSAADTGTTTTDTGSTTTDTGSSGCGSCPTGFSCGASGYCVNARGIPAFDHVYVIPMENHSLDTIIGATAAPFINMLATTYAYSTNYHAVTHPSLPNYLAMVAGDYFGVGCDCHPTGSTCNVFTCNRLTGGCGCPQTAMHIGDQLDAASLAWRAYGEGMGTACNENDDGSTHYAAKHVPFVYFSTLTSDTARCNAHVVDSSMFAADLATDRNRYSMLTPNLCNDMHDACNGGDAIANGDTWLSMQVPPILARPGFQTGGRDVLFIVWDEESVGLSSHPMPILVISPLVRGGTVTNVMYDHYATLATIEDGLGLGRIGNAVGAPVIDDVWR